MTSQQDQARRLYDRLAPVYGPVAGWWERGARRAAVAGLVLQPGEGVLEIGCGPGAALVELADAVGPGGRVAGVDVSPRMCAAARRAVARAQPGPLVEVVEGDASQLPFADGSFDVCLMSFTLELFEPAGRRQVLAECRRTLRSGGRISVAGLSSAGPDTLMRRAYRRGHRRFPTILDCRPICIAESLEEAGFLPVTDSLAHLWGLPIEVATARNP